MVPDTNENAEKCLCPSCPTGKSNVCAAEKEETLYCGKGKTACNLIDKGCICGECPLWFRYSLTGGYFCFNGKAK